MVIQRSDRIADVLRQDEGLIETFVAASSAFIGLRNPIMRRTMARLATVEQAASVAGIDVDLLVERLNGALRNHADGGGDEAAPSQEDKRSSRTTSDESTMNVTTPTDLPPALKEIPADRIVDVDVREDLRNGREPFSQIMAARSALPDGGVLRLRAIFEPAPLYAVMGKQGFDHWTEQLGEEDWRVWFYPAVEKADDGRAEPVLAVPDGEEDEAVVVLDVRGLEPPEPMVRTLAALEELPRGGTLLQINQRVPQFLLPRLKESGFRYEIREQTGDLVRVFIRHAT